MSRLARYVFLSLVAASVLAHFTGDEAAAIYCALLAILVRLTVVRDREGMGR